MANDSGFSIRGRIIRTDGGVAVSGLRVVVLGTGDGGRTVLTSAQTDRSGAFALPLVHEDLLALFRTAVAGGATQWRTAHEIELTVWNGDTIVTTQRRAIRLAEVMSAEPTTPLIVSLEIRSPQEIEIVVAVRTAAGRSLPGLAVVALAPDREGTTLAAATTDDAGEATLRITTAGGATPGDSTLRLRIAARRGADSLAISPVLYSPAPGTRVELVVRGDALGARSEFDAISDAVRVALRGRSPADLTAVEVEQLAGDVDVFPPHLGMFARAAMLARRTSIAATTWYALLRGGLSASLPALLVQRRETLARAILRAWDDVVVPPPTDRERELAARLAELRALAVQETLSPEPRTSGSLTAALATAPLAAASRTTFVARLLDHEGSLPELWASLRRDRALPVDELDTLEFTITAAALVDHHVPALDALQGLRRSGRVRELRDLASWDVPEWTTILRDVGTPDGVPGRDASERTRHYAETITRIVEELYPTETVRHRLERDRPPRTAGVAAFLRDNPSFQLDATQLDAFVAANPSARPPDATTLANLRTVQRIHQLTPRLQRYDAMRAVLGAGFDSAAAIVHRGVDGFVDGIAAQLEGVHPQLAAPVLARTIFDAARVRHGAAIALLSRFGAAFNDVTMTVLASGELPQTDATANLRELFGSLDYCACEHCRSMFGPAAYLVALLSLLESRAAVAANTTALQVLEARRADLTGIELSCTNTNTVLPYIDLVLELLEQAVLVPGAPFVARQTTWTAAELRTGAEHRLGDAYVVPALAVFPWSLPFDLSSEQVRAFMRQLGVPRVEAMGVLQLRGPSPQPADASIVAEALQTSAHELQLVSGATAFPPAVIAPTPLARAWGLDEGADVAAILAADVGQTLDRSRLSFDELTALLALPFVDPDDVAAIHFDEPSCNLADARLVGFDAALADRLHRFVRLWRRTGLAPDALDRAIRVLGSGELDATFLTRMVALLDASARLRADTDTLLGLWAPLDTRLDVRGRSPYHALFQNRQITPELDAAFSVSDGADELDAVVPLAEVHVATIRAALRVGAADLSLLVAAVLPPAPMLDLANLSALFRHAWLGRAARWSVPDLLRLLAIVGQSPFAARDPASCARFLDEAERVKRSGMSPEVLDYVLRHRFNPDTDLVPSDEAREDVLDAIVAAAAAIEAALAVVTGTLADRLRAFLSMLPPEIGRIDEWMRIVALSPAAVSPGDTAFLLAGFAVFTDAPTAVADLAALEGDPRGEMVLGRVLAHLRRVGRVEALVPILADYTSLAPEAIVVLGERLLHVGGVAIVEVLLDEAFLLDVGSRDAPREALVRLHKAATIVRGLSVGVEDLAWYFAPGSPQGLDLDALPLVAIDSGEAGYAGWRRVQLGLELRGAIRGANPFPEASVAVDLDSALDLLAARTGWDRDDLGFVCGPELLAIAPAELADPDVLTAIVRALDLGRRTGVRVATLATWARQSSGADEVLRALRSRYSEQQWPEVITPIVDRQRERQRDALVDVLVARGDFRDDDDLYRRLLVDPRMNAKTLTSRIRLAMSSVQLFISRILMNLESAEVVFPAEVAERWSWMKTYRVWEANRKVFFYPENWVEPELRTDKSPFFVELEQQIGQGEITDASVEDALRAYLRKVHEVAHLQTVALWRDAPDEGGEVVHVLSRTRGLPPRYFHRTRIDDRVWTPWQLVPVDIQGDQVTIAVHNRRLFVFWAEIQHQTVERPAPKPKPKKIDEAVETSEPPFHDYHARIGWTEFRDGRWAPKKLTPLSGGFYRVDWEVPNDGFVIMAYHVGAPPPKLRVEVIRRIEVAGTQSVQESDGEVFQVRSPLAVRRNTTFARFLYDDCRDVLDEQGGSFAARTDGDLGMGHGVQIAAQRHIASGSDDLDVLYYSNVVSAAVGETSYVHATLLTNLPRRYSVTVARQRALYAGDTPVVFDDARRSLYIAPVSMTVWRSGGRAPGGTIPIRSTHAGSGSWAAFGNEAARSWDLVLAEDRPSSVASMVAAPPAWGGSVPGARALVDAPLELDASAALAHTQALVEAPMGAGALTPTAEPLGGSWVLARGWRIDPFHHPYSCLLLATLERHGVEGLYTQTARQTAWRGIVIHDDDDPTRSYRPTSRVTLPDTLDEYDFSPGGAYSIYNWELFFHVPLLLAEKLRKEQRFEEAQRWYHFVFNPLAGVTDDDSGAERFWNVKPFYTNARDHVPDIIRAIFQDEGLDAPAVVIDGFVKSVLAWIDDPFEPHAIARVRPGTYEKVVVRKYLDNLIDWADSLFRRDTIETIDEATQLYMLAAAILGPRPRRLSAIDPPVRTYRDLDQQWLFGGLTELENYVVGELPNDFAFGSPPPPVPPVWWYFCLPPNDQLLRYWDVVADRLFKIRNSMNIDGIERSLALFDPPIDPALLVRARAAGVDIGAAIAGLGAPLPHYRYAGLLRRALDVCNEVKGLGSALLSALEKKDAEHLALLRQSHEIAVLEATLQVRKQQVDEAQGGLEGLTAQKAVVEDRQRYYASREKHSGLEKTSMALGGVAAGFQLGAQIMRSLAGTLHLVPNLTGGMVGIFPTALVQYGGNNVGPSLTAAGDGLDITAGLARHGAELTNTLAGYQRRYDDWQFQAGQAKLELAQLDKQILAAEIRLAITQQELANTEQQIEQSQAVDAYMRSKYTNEQLYDWMVGQISTVHFGAYKLAFDLAKKAERALQFELGRDDLAFIDAGAWDSLRRGLLAGDVLGQALRRMDAAYVDNDRRHPELTRRISLRQLDANALVDLQASGTCTFSLPEVLFDLDHPGMYMRRIKAVSVSLMATVGPHTSVGGRLSLVSDWIRVDPSLDGGYPRGEPASDDLRFQRGPGGVQSIATSRGRDDAGMFQLDFRDERYLPFEGAGVISDWRFELPPVRQFDYGTISDLEIQIQYTARDGGPQLRDAASEATAAAIASTIDELNELGMYMLLAARADFASAWERLLRPAEGEQSEPLPIPIVLDRFPYVARARGIMVDAIDLVWIGAASAVSLPSPSMPASLSLGGDVFDVTLQVGEHGLLRGAVAMTGPVELAPSGGPWALRLGDGGVADPDALEDLYVLVRYHTAT